jgi:hypothetical protein
MGLAHSNNAPHACYKTDLRPLGQGPPGKIPCMPDAAPDDVAARRSWSRPRSPTGRRPPSPHVPLHPRFSHCQYIQRCLHRQCKLHLCLLLIASVCTHLCSRRVPQPLCHRQEPPVSTTFLSSSLPHPRAAIVRSKLAT